MNLQRATIEFNHYMTKKTASASLTRPEGLTNVWQNMDKKDFPAFTVVAIAQLGTPPGSGVLENDFSTFANLFIRRRSLLDTGIIEMILFCKLNHMIPEINSSDIMDNKSLLDSAIPTCKPSWKT